MPHRRGTQLFITPFPTSMCVPGFYLSKNLAFTLPDHREISKQDGKYTDLSFASLSLLPLNLSAPSRIQKCQGLCTELPKPLPLHKAENVFQSDYQKKQMHAA